MRKGILAHRRVGSASRGLSAAAELLVMLCITACANILKNVIAVLCHTVVLEISNVYLHPSSP